MKHLLLILSTTILLSCGKDYYLTVSSNNAFKNDQRELVFENDTVKIVYRFDRYPLVNLTIFNKSSKPIEVNWKKSAIIMDEQTTAYYSSTVNVKGDVRIDTTRSLFRNSGSGNFNGQLLRDQAVQFLPPQSRVSRRIELYIPWKKVRNLPFDTSSNHLIKKNRQGSFDFNYKKVTFQPDESPIRFRSFITLDNGSGQETFLDHHFYVTEAWRSKFSEVYMRQYGDQLFY